MYKIKGMRRGKGELYRKKESKIYRKGKNKNTIKGIIIAFAVCIAFFVIFLTNFNQWSGENAKQAAAVSESEKFQKVNTRFDEFLAYRRTF